MPGFKLGINADNTSGNLSANIAPVLSYAWEVPALFDDVLTNQKPVIYLRDCTLPEPTFDVETYEAASIKLKYAKKIDWGDVKVTFYDTDGILSKMATWRNNVWASDKGIKPAASYKKDTRIQVLNMDGSTQGEWKLYGSWPKSVTYSQLTYTASDMHTVVVTVTYDWAQYE